MDKTLAPDEVCRVVQDDARSEPLILLRKGEGLPVLTLTIQQAHEELDRGAAEYTGWDDSVLDVWWPELNDVLAGIR